MTIVKTVQFRKNLKKILQDSHTQKVFIDYYGELFEIKPAQSDADQKNTPKTKTQKLIEKYSNLPPMKLTDPIFNEADPAQEKKNFRELMAKRYEK